jgi:hypothetical protein
MEIPTAKAKNTTKARKYNLEEAIVELIGEKSGLVVFKYVKSKDVSEFYSIEEEAFDKYFEFKFSLDALPKIELENWNIIKSQLKKFS